MHWVSALSTEPEANAALTTLKGELLPELGSARPDLLFAFVSPHHADRYRHIAEQAHALFSPRVFIGCTALGVIGGCREIEQRPALALCAAVLPGVQVYPFHLAPGHHPGPDTPPDAWAQFLGVPRDQPAHFVLLADPVGPPLFDPRPFLAGLDFAYPGSTQIGGLASVAQGNALFLDEEVLHSGLVGLALQGNVVCDTLVAQGCRPIGPPMTVTACQEYLLLELDDHPAFQVLAQLYQSLPEEDQERMRYALHIGIATTELKADLQQGDFLMRNVLHLDHEQGFIAVGDTLSTGQTVQFHLRDAEAAAEDLKLLLDRYAGRSSSPPTGALLFTCTGRGQHLFGQPDHDSRAFFQALGEVPLSGFFCGGEIGPVGQATYLHGYTSSFGLFRPLKP